MGAHEGKGWGLGEGEEGKGGVETAGSKGQMPGRTALFPQRSGHLDPQPGREPGGRSRYWPPEGASGAGAELGEGRGEPAEEGQPRRQGRRRQRRSSVLRASRVPASGQGAQPRRRDAAACPPRPPSGAPGTALAAHLLPG